MHVTPATVLVTGANGFIGQFLCRELHGSGYRVRAAVRNEQRGQDLPVELVAVGDLNGETDWSAAVSQADVVIHLAARVHVMDENARDPLAAFRAINVHETVALAYAAVRAGVKRFVYVSSIKVNGEATGSRPFTSQDLPQPEGPYGISKWEAERALWKIASDTGLEVTVVRPPLVYGPGVGGNFARLLKLVERRIPLPLGAVSNHRSMVYVENLTSALISCALHPAAAGQTYLVSDGEDLSTPALIRHLGQMINAPARLWPVPTSVLMLAGSIARKRGEVERLIGSLRVDSTGLQTSLGWVPPFTVAQGLERTASWFKHRPR